MLDIAAATTEDLLAAIRLNKNDVFAQLVAQYHLKMLSIARSFLREQEAEEVVQEAWISTYKGLGKFEGRSSLRTWITRIVINQAKAHLRKSGREFRVTLPDAQSSYITDRFNEDGSWRDPPCDWELDSPEEMLQQRELMSCLQNTLHALPENQRLVLELRDIQGFELEDICNTLDISASNVRVLLHRARSQLFNKVDHYQRTGKC